jgi:dCMP deaminase
MADNIMADNIMSDNIMADKWDMYFLKLATLSSTMSKDPSTKVGASIRGPDKSVISVGFNGFPTEMYDDPLILNNRVEKYKYVIHAEDNAIRFALNNRIGLLKDCTIYTTFPPCINCYKIIRSAGIKQIVTYEPTDEQKNRWSEEWNTVKEMCSKDKISITYFKN